MTILCIEGVKGTGKSTLVRAIEEKKGIQRVKKFSKGDGRVPSFLQEYEQRYRKDFFNIQSSLGLTFYGAFFERVKSNTTLLFEKGLISLPSSGYYGYVTQKEIIPFTLFREITFEVFRTALLYYQPFAEETLFLLLESSPEEIQKRLSQRRQTLADRIFLDNRKVYLEFQSDAEEYARQILPRAQFVREKNNIPEDKERILEKIQYIF